MKCIKCGVNLNEGASYCIRCGSYQNDIQQQNNKINHNLKNDRVINYDILEQVYVGSKYNNFIYSKFSWLCFLLGPLYTLCRKMYSFSVIYFLVLSVVSVLASLVTWWFEIIAIIVICWFFAHSFKKTYLGKVKTRVNKIVMDNPELDMVMLQEKCRKKGGLNIFFVILASLSFIFVLIIFSLLIYMVLTSNFNLIENTKENYYKSEIKEICEQIKNNILFISPQEFESNKRYELRTIIGLEEYSGYFSFDSDNNVSLIDVKVKDKTCNGVCASNIICK